MKFLQCFWYLILISILSFPLGRVLPKRWFRWNRFPFRSFSFERDGRIYEKLQIRKWKTKVPDMSRILPFLMPAKAFSADYEKKLPRMIEETCVAEWIHGLNCLAG